MWRHWVLRASTPYEPFHNQIIAREAWNFLIESFEAPLAAVLMPNHLHLILSDSSEQMNRRKFFRLMGRISRLTKIPHLWQTMPEPALIPDRHHLRRQIRYIALNPCRKGLCKDPLEWIWSTHREVVGAAGQSLSNFDKVARALGERANGFAGRWHTYVSSDPSVAVAGTPYPCPIPGRQVSYESLGQILNAAAAALRLDPSAVKRKGPLRPLFVHLALRQGWSSPSSLAAICGITPRGIRLIKDETPPLSLGAAAICLGDARLTPPSQLPESGSKSLLAQRATPLTSPFGK